VIEQWFDALLDLGVGFESWLFETLIQPIMFELGLMAYLDDAFDWLDVFLLGVVQVVVVYLICRPLEKWRPLERWTDRRGVRTDIVFTLLQRLGLLPLLVFLAMNPAALYIERTLRMEGIVPPTLEQLLPGLTDSPFLTFLLYVVILDFADYWRHRMQHRLGWWWALHSIHHNQRQMTFWSDDRGHILDEFLAAVWFGAVALAIGVEPAQFPIIVMLLRGVESLSHANVRLSFGRFGELALVSPHFHRVHHAVEHAAPPHDRHYGCNFAVILPIWDLLFRSYKPDPSFPPTGDLTTPPEAASAGFVGQQIHGLKRLKNSLLPPPPTLPSPLAGDD
jgi:sterol desaturase/sphingolipid hydroxylase (fatty acid hydroxylase superfamily)